MKHVVRKLYWNYEKEEKWLNEMSAKGLALTSYSWNRYVFEETPKGEYIYRIELLDNTINHPESQKYIQFLEEAGVEFVASYMRWIYIRKKAVDGNFDIYSDIDSKIKHYEKVNLFWNTFAGIEFGAGSVNLVLGLAYYVFEGEFIFNIALGFPLILLGFLFLYLGMPLRKKIKMLKKEKEIRE